MQRESQQCGPCTQGRSVDACVAAAFSYGCRPPVLSAQQPRGVLRRLCGAAQEVRAAYGDDENNFYAADTFNEMDPGTNDPAYLRNASSAVYNVCGLAPR